MKDEGGRMKGGRCVPCHAEDCRSIPWRPGAARVLAGSSLCTAPQRSSLQSHSRRSGSGSGGAASCPRRWASQGESGLSSSQLF